jgi:hypothetical protein
VRSEILTVILVGYDTMFIGKQLTSIMEDLAAFIFRVEADNCSLVDIMSHPTRHESSKQKISNMKKKST